MFSRLMSWIMLFCVVLFAPLVCVSGASGVTVGSAVVLRSS